jgi:hypothetical protein
MRKTLLGLSLVAALGCADKNIEIARRLTQPDPGGGEPTVLTVGNCRAGGLDMERVCIVDSDGTTPPYGAYFLFNESATPQAQDISTEGEAAAVQVYAAVTNTNCPRYPEERPANRIAARASLTPEGGVLVTVHDVLAAGTQVVVFLEYSALFRGRLALYDGGCPLDRHPVGLCPGKVGGGWLERFHIGAAPSPETVTPCPGQ